MKYIVWYIGSGSQKKPDILWSNILSYQRVFQKLLHMGAISQRPIFREMLLTSLPATAEEFLGIVGLSCLESEYITVGLM